MNQPMTPALPERFCFIAIEHFTFTTLARADSSDASRSCIALLQSLKAKHLDPVFMVAASSDCCDLPELFTRISGTWIADDFRFITFGYLGEPNANTPKGFLLNEELPSDQACFHADSRADLTISSKTGEFQVTHSFGTSPQSIDDFDVSRFAASLLKSRWDHGNLAELAKLDSQDPSVRRRWRKPIVDGNKEDAFLSVCRARARVLGQEFRRRPFLILLLHALATLLASIKAAFHIKGVAAVGIISMELLLVLVAVWLWARLRRSEPSNRWAVLRTTAELIKAMKGTLNFPGRKDFLPSSLRASYADLFDTVRCKFWIDYKNCAESVSQTQFAEDFLRTRINYQLVYYQDQYAKSRMFVSIANALLLLVWVALIIALSLSLYAAHSTNSAISNDWLLFLPLALPVASGSLILIPNILDLKRRVLSYHAVVSRLNLLSSILQKRFPSLPSGHWTAELSKDNNESFLPTIRCLKFALKALVMDMLAKARALRLIPRKPATTKAIDLVGADSVDGWPFLAFIVAETNLCTLTESLEYSGFVKNVETG